MHVLYGLHTVAWVSMGMLAVIALIVNYIKRADEHDAVYVEPPQLHDRHLLVDGAVAGGDFAAVAAAVPVPGAIAYTIVGLWYLYRCMRGWLRFTDGRPPF